MPIPKSLRQVTFATGAPIFAVWHLAPGLRCSSLLAGGWSAELGLAIHMCTSTAAAVVNVLEWTP